MSCSFLVIKVSRCFLTDLDILDISLYVIYIIYISLTSDQPGALASLATQAASPFNAWQQSEALTEENQSLGHLVRGLQQRVSHVLHLDEAAQSRGDLKWKSVRFTFSFI